VIVAAFVVVVLLAALSWLYLCGLL